VKKGFLPPPRTGAKAPVTPSRNGVAEPCDAVTCRETPSLLGRKIVLRRRRRRSRTVRQVRQNPAAIAYCNFNNIAFEEGPVLVPAA
jgi:hypothetical protein